LKGRENGQESEGFQGDDYKKYIKLINIPTDFDCGLQR
jgi:hypothetical protein